ncbi:MAG: AAA family ATPase [Deltaproteobacteria bacterium]|nr:AAA family ATPase [Deltaproteobacteria bacterium]
MRPKTFQVLRCLVEQQGRVVSKQALLQAVWPGVHVSDGGLRVCIREIREALGDDPASPQFIKTEPRRGYRFIGKVVGKREKVIGETLPPTPYHLSPTTSLVGREAELKRLQGLLEKAVGGNRQVVFVAGEAGIGKTTLVDAFIAQVTCPAPGHPQGGAPTARQSDIWFGRGQCIENHGAGEAYLPVLEALGHVCHQPGGEDLIRLFARYAPMWLAQMPWLISEGELDALQRKIQGASPERMLREMAEAVEALTAGKALVLWLEDLQWSDYSTWGLVSYLAQRRKSAQLLVIGTYRPLEAITSPQLLGRKVVQELQRRGQCEEMWLECLAEEEVTEYLKARFPLWTRGAVPVETLAQIIHRRTEGNPLFMVNMADYLVRQAMMVEEDGKWELKVGLERVDTGIPAGLRQMIERQVDDLKVEEKRVLEAGSMAGVEFCVAEVAAGIKREVSEVEEVCEELTRRGQFLRSRGMEEWPDGTVGGRYSFVHALYQSVLYERLAEARRIRLHSLIGEWREDGYRERVGEIARELAVQFERGRDCDRAGRYLGLAGENSLRRHAYREAVNDLTKGLELLKTLPDTPARTQQELLLQIAFGASLMAIKGYADPEVGKAYGRARELCRQVGNTPQLFPALWGLCAFYLLRAELQTARELGEQFFSLAQSAQDPALLLPARDALGASLFWRGELAEARAHDEQGIALYDPKQHHSLVFLYGYDRGVLYLASTARHLHALGYPDQALKRNQEALALARELAHPYSLAIALNFSAMLHQFRREGQAAQEQAEAAIALSTDQGFPLWAAFGTMLRGWALTERGKGKKGIAQMRQGLDAFAATGAELTRSYFLVLLAEAYGKAGGTEQGLTLLAEARDFVDKHGERFYEAEIYRLKGELLLKIEDRRSEMCFSQAIEIAGRQGAKFLELRAVTSLSRLLQKQGKKETARKLLAESYGWFTEGFDTPDLKEAKALLEDLDLSVHGKT